MTRPSKGDTSKKRKKGDANCQAPKVAEATRIRIAQKLEEFRTSTSEEVCTFEENLRNEERALVHLLCRKLGMISKSTGRGNQRHVSVYKTKKKVDTMKGKENLSFLTLSEASKDVLLDLLRQYPPGQDGLEELNLDVYSKINKKLQSKRDDIFCKPLMTKAEIEKKVEAFSSRIKHDSKFREVQEQRSRLPITSSREDITSKLICHQVVLISGETGCGKTTQVPQYLLDGMWEAGESCKVICTQPRRISATSVAERIAYERGEGVGETIGYKIRLESKGGRHSSIMFCTNGVLLRMLVCGGLVGSEPGSSSGVANSYLSEITHIVVDEIHERDHYCDFMLAILRDLLPRYPHLRLVLMSATMDAERFSGYFGDCPIVQVPGFTYPVKIFFLEDILSILKSTEKNNLDSTSSSSESGLHELTDEHKIALDEAIELAWSNDDFDSLLEMISSEGTSKVLDYQHSLTRVSALMVFAAKGRVGDVCMLLSLGADCHLKAQDGSTALDWAKRSERTEAAEIIDRHFVNAPLYSKEDEELVDKYMSSINPELIDVVLIEHLLRKICVDSKDGAILVFLPGWDDINRTKENLLVNPFFKNPSKYRILAMHSMVPSVEQKKVFNRPPPGCRKIILSTNIAETAITVEDVVFVIDSGRMKEKNYDPYNNVSTLQSSWTSKASAKQREGRAGRCQPGFCYHLYSKLRAVSLPDFQIPEIKRMPIEELCLQVKMLDPNYKIEEFLKKTLDPPVFESIRNAIAVLVEIGAISSDEILTELGKKLGSLPVHPLISKMLFFAILLNCLEPALTLACASDYRDPFTLPMLPNEKKRAADAKKELAALYGGHSDQLAVVAAFECWRNAKQKGQDARFCSQYFISSGTMTMLAGMRKQLQRELVFNGYIPDDISSCSFNAQDPGIIRAVLVAGLYPRVGRLHAQNKNAKRVIVETASGDRVRLHQQSMCPTYVTSKFNGGPLIVYDEITRGDGGLHIRKCSVIGTIPLVLLATEIVVAPARDCDDDEDIDNEDDSASDYEDYEEGEGVVSCDKSKKLEGEVMSSPDNSVTVIVDRWLSFQSTALEVAQIYCMRERLSASIILKATNPRNVLPPALGASVYAIACILSYDGMCGMSSVSESVDALTSMVNATEIGRSFQRQKAAADQTPNSFLRSLFYPSATSHYSSSSRKARFVSRDTVNRTYYSSNRDH
ncbi:hypothetical protein V2J09_017962 [Rumex salicifolius]